MRGAGIIDSTDNLDLVLAVGQATVADDVLLKKTLRPCPRVAVGPTSRVADALVAKAEDLSVDLSAKRLQSFLPARGSGRTLLLASSILALGAG